MLCFGSRVLFDRIQRLNRRLTRGHADSTATIAQGEVCSGGSYLQRASSIAVWNTTVDDHYYLTRRWAELVAGG